MIGRDELRLVPLILGTPQRASLPISGSVRDISWFHTVECENDMESDGRRHPVHLPSLERFNTPIIVFLTVCTKDREPILANDSAQRLLSNAWQTNPSWRVGRYIIM